MKESSTTEKELIPVGEVDEEKADAKNSIPYLDLLPDGVKQP